MGVRLAEDRCDTCQHLGHRPVHDGGHATGQGSNALLANQPAAERGDAEDLHRTRMTISRLRPALMLFLPRLEPHAAARSTVELRPLLANH